MNTGRMAAADAQLLWLSAIVPNDQFLVYVFDGAPPVAAAVEEMRRNAEACPELRLRVRDQGRLRYPRWVYGGVRAEQFTVHQPVGHWREGLQALPRLSPLDVTRMAWRVHVFPPGVVVVQMSHALGDGTRSAALAGALFGRRVALTAVLPDRGNLVWRGIAAARAHRRLEREIASGVMESPPPARPALSVNARSDAPPVLRTLVVDRDRLRRPTVTVGALSAIAEALGGYLAARGEDIGLLGAEVPMAGPSSTKLMSAANNGFRNVNVGLHPQLDARRRADRIAGELAARRRRTEHPATRASDDAFGAVPAALLRWGVGRFDAAARSATVAGHTVVSSVNRGPADLYFGGHRVVLTAGYPALSPMMGLTHGVHGIGDTVAVSVRADPGTVDVDDYVDRLAHALGCRS